MDSHSNAKMASKYSNLSSDNLSFDQVEIIDEQNFIEMCQMRQDQNNGGSPSYFVSEIQTQADGMTTLPNNTPIPIFSKVSNFEYTPTRANEFPQLRE